MVSTRDFRLYDSCLPHCFAYTSAISISGSWSTVAEKRIFGMLSVHTVQGEVRAGHGLGSRVRSFELVACIKILCWERLPRSLARCVNGGGFDLRRVS
jgi:hypothetical protein